MDGTVQLLNYLACQGAVAPLVTYHEDSGSLQAKMLVYLPDIHML